MRGKRRRGSGSDRVTGTTRTGYDAAQLRAILETSVEGIITIDEQGIIESFNRSAERIFGYRADEVIGKNVSLLMPAPDRERHDAYLTNYLKTGEQKIIGVGRDVLGLRKDGSTFPLHLSVSEVRYGGGRIFTGFVHDLTDRRKAEDLATRLGRIIENSTNEVYVYDADSLCFTMVNRGARENLGYTMEELCRLTPYEIKPGFTRNEFEELIRPLKQGRQHLVQFEATHQRKDGTTYPVDVHLQLTRSTGSASFISIVVDASERLEYEAKLRETERLAALGEAMAGLAHESRNALQRIQVASEMLQELVGDEDEAVHYIRVIQRAQNDLQRVLQEVREYAAPIHLGYETAGVDALVRGVWNDLTGERGGREVGFTEHADACDLECELDLFAMGQVFRNILENALAACGDTGQIEVTYSDARLGSTEAIVVRIRDSGPGIAPEDCERVFDSFYTTKTKGTGLGLAISRRIVQAHGGRIVANPQCREGAEFVITLPRTRPSGTQHVSPA